MSVRTSSGAVDAGAGLRAALARVAAALRSVRTGGTGAGAQLLAVGAGAASHPDVADAFVRTVVQAGYRWVLVQEHTVEQSDGQGPRDPHLRHALSCSNSGGESASILALVKTRSSDTKLVAQMQPYYEAHTLERATLDGRSVPPLVTPIADGENGGVMMNEFPPKYRHVVRESSGSETPMLNGTEYLERVFASGVREHDLPVIPPLFQHRIWGRMAPGDGPERLAGVIEELSREDDRLHIEGGSWTNDVSWLRGHAARARCRRSRAGHSSDPQLARSRRNCAPRQVPPHQPAVDVLWPAGLEDQRQHGGGGRRCQDQSGAVGPTCGAETSCNFYWAEAWVHRCHQHLDSALEHLEQASGQLA